MTSRAVFIGSSNAIPGTWPETFGARNNFTVHNYSVGGGSFTGAGPGRFANQVTAAMADISYPRSEVELFVVADAGNDVRAIANVQAEATSVLTTIAATYPTARIVIIPALWGIATLNSGAGQMMSVTQRYQELLEAALQVGAEVVPFSWTWHFDKAAWMRPATATESGVHYTPAGYLRVIQFLERYLAGGDTDSPIGWKYATEKSGSYGNWVRARRDRNEGRAFGVFSTYGVGRDVDLMMLPVGTAPYESLTFTAVANETRAPFSLSVYPSGLVRSFGALGAGTYTVSESWPVF